MTSKVKYGIGIDVGTGFMAIDVFDGKRLTPIPCAVNGTQVPTIAYFEAEKENWHFGKAALMHSYDDDGDTLFMHFKRRMYESAHEKCYGSGQFSAVDIAAELLRYAKQLIIAAKPDLEPHLGGQSEEVAVCLTAPANWSIEQHTALAEAATMAGFGEVMFAAEPIVAARRLMNLGNVTLEHGDIVLVVDCGAGTSDLSLISYNAETNAYDQLKKAGGSPYFAGHDLTNALAEHFAKECRVSWKSVYGKEGLNLSGIDSNKRQRVVAVWSAAEEAKTQLSAMEEATVLVDLPKGRKKVSVTREQALSLWAGCREEFKRCISESLEETDFRFLTSSISRLLVDRASVSAFATGWQRILGEMQRSLLSVPTRNTSSLEVLLDLRMAKRKPTKPYHAGLEFISRWMTWGHFGRCFLSNQGR